MLRAVVVVLSLGLAACLAACTEERSDGLIDRDAIMAIATGDRFLPGGSVPAGDREIIAFGVDSSAERIAAARGTRDHVFERPDVLPWEWITSSTAVTTSARRDLYFAVRGGAVPALRAASVSASDGAIGAVEPVAIEGTNVSPFWPQAVALPDGRILLTFVDPHTQVFLGTDDGSGRHFEVAPVSLPEDDLSGVLAHVGITAGGAWVLAYQVADAGWHFRSSVRLSHDDGATWIAMQASALSAGAETRHAYPIARRDRGADLYYVATRAGVVTIRRRALREDGTLGAEQIVTPTSLGHALYPQPRRLADGRVALFFALERSSRESDLVVAMLPDDAPP